MGCRLKTVREKRKKYCDLISGNFIITFEHKYDLKENDKLKLNTHISFFKRLEESASDKKNQMGKNINKFWGKFSVQSPGFNTRQ